MTMHRHLPLVALLAATTLSVLVGSASANRLSVTNRSIRMTWSSLEFRGPVTIRCRLTLEGTLHENTIAKVERSLIGYVTAARFQRPCTGGTMWSYNGSEVNEVLGGTLPTSLPWHITYEGFNGALPTPTAIRILLALWRYEVRGVIFGIPVLCTYRTGAAGNATGTANLGSGGRIESLSLSGNIASEDPSPCASLAFQSPAGDGRVTLLGTTNAISITLI